MNVPEKKQALEALARLLDSAPAFGFVSLSVHVHDGQLDRIEELRSEARKAKPRPLHG